MTLLGSAHDKEKKKKKKLDRGIMDFTCLTKHFSTLQHLCYGMFEAMLFLKI